MFWTAVGILLFFSYRTNETDRKKHTKCWNACRMHRRNSKKLQECMNNCFCENHSVSHCVVGYASKQADEFCKFAPDYAEKYVKSNNISNKKLIDIIRQVRKQIRK
ncbi:hypothetical protein TetV_014 [Tetraselmis virus 1]|uniref:Uncharacterized protein n=1 Tax=Tetraselmis virus 1 TaxID=2060617 RepID=A0A2P0VMJ3_9VIRU|nr:hypothetical protein QJ968_gp014 [Tetraselmis virus 1]AUF82106.1 hypothetical protein TetV_014 [Tetraselmis virus 1]